MSLESVAYQRRMIVIALLIVASTALIYAASALQYRGYGWADATCAYARDACASPNSVAIAAIALISVFFVMQAIKKAK